MKTWRLPLDVLRFDRRRTFAGAVLVALAAVLEGAGLALLLPVAQTALEGGEVDFFGIRSLTGAILAFSAVGLLAAVISFMRDRAMIRLEFDFVDALRLSAHEALLRMKPDAAEEEASARTLHMLTTDVNRAGLGVQVLLTGAALSVQIPALIVVMLAVSRQGALVVLALAALLALLIVPIDRRARRIAQGISADTARPLEALDETLAHLSTIKTHGVETERQRQFQAAVATERRRRTGFREAHAAAAAVAKGGAVLSGAAVLWAILTVIDVGLAEAAVLLAILARLLPLTARMQAAWRTLAGSAPAYKVVCALIDRARAAGEDRQQAQPMAGPVALAAANLSLSRGNPPVTVINEANFTIPAGSLTVVTGASGAGKTTLLRALAGLSEPSSGSLSATLAGESADLRPLAILCPQDAALFSGTLGENLRLGAGHYDEAALIDALALADSGDLQSRLRDGLDTAVSPRGRTFSGGQRHRIALARAFLWRKGLLLLDEPTAALDAAAEDHLIESLALLKGDLTLVIATHRSGMAETADQVLHIQDGKVITRY